MVGSVTSYETRSGRRWRARYRAGGREVSRSFRRKLDAERWLASQQTDRLRGEWADPAWGRRRYGDWLAAWLTSRRGRPSTRARDEAYARNQLAPRWHGWRLADIHQPDVVAWVAALEAAGLAPATVVKAYQLFAGSMQGAVDAGLIARSPCRRVPLPKVEREEMRFLTPAEVAHLTDVIDPRWSALVWVAAYGGLRISELAGLRVADVDPLRAGVGVSQQLVWVRGRPHFGPPKTRAGRRRVVLPRSAADELAAHITRALLEGRGLDHRRQIRPAGDTPDDEPTRLVFTAPEGGPLRPSHFRRRVWRPAVEAAGLAPLRVHDLRHTAVALWIAAGADVKTVASRAGHTSVATVLDRYGHLYPDADVALARRLDDLAVSAQRAASVVPLDRDERPVPGSA